MHTSRFAKTPPRAQTGCSSECRLKFVKGEWQMGPTGT